MKRDPLVLLDYLVGVANKTEGADVWRALFAEMRATIIRDANVGRWEEVLPGKWGVKYRISGSPWVFQSAEVECAYRDIVAALEGKLGRKDFSILETERL